MTPTRSRLALVVALLATLTVLTACGGGTASSTESTSSGTTALDRQMDGLYQAAVSSGETSVTVYGAGATNWQPLVDKFTERYPDITFDLVSLIGADQVTRLSAEFTSGQHTADMAFGPISQGIFTPRYNDWYAPFSPANAADLPGWAAAPDQRWIAPYVAVFGLAYNADRLDAAAAPQTWSDLADPKWRGRIGMDDPKIASAASVAMTYAFADGKIDNAWIQKFAANDPKVFASARRSQALLSGEVDAAIYPLSVLVNDRVNGAPLVFQPGTAATQPSAVAVLEGAPNPDAARLFSAWLVGPDAQDIYARQGQYPSMPGAALPDGFAPDNPTLTTPMSVETFDRLYAEVRQTWTTLQP